MTRPVARLGLVVLALALTLVAMEIAFRIADIAPPRRALRQVWLTHPERRLIDTWALGKLYAPSADRKLAALRGEFIPGIRFEVCYDVRTPAERRPSFDDRGCVAVSINTDSLRGPAVSTRKPLGTWRFAAIGDSFTFGEGVALPAAWPARVAALLADSGRWPAVEVVNAGIPGFTAKDTLEYLKHKVVKYYPDHVVYGFFLNDVFPGNVSQDELVTLIQQLSDPPTGLAARSRVVDWVTWTRRRAELGRLTEALYRGSFAGGGLSADDWADTQEHILAMKELCDRRGAGFLMVIFPVLMSLGDDYPFEDIHQRVRDFCDTHGIAWVDMLEPWRAHASQELVVHMTDHHPNEFAHELAAERIAAALLEQTLDDDR